MVVEPWVVDALAEGIPADQLVMEFQPVVRISTGEVWGAESFLRWNHPERGMVPALQWLPAAAASGALVDLSLLAMTEWAATAEDLGGPTISFNVDGLLLADDRALAALLAVAPGAAGRMAVEIHQLQFFADRAVEEQPLWTWVDVPDLDDRLAALRARGFEVWLDDFGDGSDDLSTVRHPQVDVVKIDRGLLGMPVAELAGVVDAIHGAGKTALVEGVETEAEGRHVADAGVDLVQGFLYSWPLSGDDLIARHGKRRESST